MKRLILLVSAILLLAVGSWAAPVAGHPANTVSAHRARLLRVRHRRHHRHHKHRQAHNHQHV